LDAWPSGAEVGELLGVELGDEGCIPRGDQMPQGFARGITGVVPAGEGGDEPRLANHGFGKPADVLHTCGAYPSSGAMGSPTAAAAASKRRESSPS
jgi:hypothetical protein